MSARCFVDTNVLVYARDASEPVKQAVALRVMERLWHSRQGRLSVQVLSEFYVTVTRKLMPGMDPAAAWADVQSLFAWEPCGVDSELLTRAHVVEVQARLSWWDSLIVAGAQVCGCDVLLTEDLGDGQVVGGVRIVNPFGEAPEPF